MTVDGNADLRRAQAILVAVLMTLPDMKLGSYDMERVVLESAIRDYSTHGLAAVIEEGHISIAMLAQVATALQAVLGAVPARFEVLPSGNIAGAR